MLNNNDIKSMKGFKNTVIIIGIVGPVCSGKSVLA
jgi:uridine kinase